MTLHHKTKIHQHSSRTMATEIEVGEEVQNSGPTKQHLHNNPLHSHRHQWLNHLHQQQHLRPTHLHQQGLQGHSHKLASNHHHKGASTHLRLHNIMASKAIQVITILTTIQEINTEVVIKATEAAEAEEDTEVAGVVMEVTREEDCATYVKMTQDSSTSPNIVQPSTLLHLGENTLQPQVDATVAPAKYTQVNATNYKNVHIIQVKNTGPTYAEVTPTLVKMHDNHSNK